MLRACPAIPPLPQRIRAGCDGFGMSRLSICGPLPQRIRAGCDRDKGICPGDYYNFATAHSCGLRHGRRHGQGRIPPLCHSAFVRVATGESKTHKGYTWTLPQRIRAGCDKIGYVPKRRQWALPQRIRAGCDVSHAPRLPSNPAFATAHSCGLRRIRNVKIVDLWAFATAHSCGLRQGQRHLPWGLLQLCHSAFVRVATFVQRERAGAKRFATAHSCGLRRRNAADGNVSSPFATAHSCGLRRRRGRHSDRMDTLPQRIRAGCDCGKAMQRTANLLREGR